MFLPHLIPAWFLPHSTLSPSHPQPPFPMHPLLHLISLSQSIQIFFIGMTGPVVGDSHRHGGTMHCDGDIHMIMPSDLILQQIHLDSRSLSLFFLLFIPSPFLPPPPPVSVCMCIYVLTFKMVFKCCSLFMLCPSLPLSLLWFLCYSLF